MEDRIKKDIIKLNYINNKRIDENQIPEKIIVFYGRTNPITKKNWEITVDELNSKFISYIESITGGTEIQESDENYTLFNDIFSDTELQNISIYKINVEFSFERLYGDDTIETIKKKIISNLKLEKQMSFDELYLFYKHQCFLK